MTKRLKVYIDDNVYDRLMAHVRATGDSESGSAFVRKLIHQALSVEEIADENGISPNTPKDKVLRVRVNHDEYTSFQARMKQEGLDKKSSLLLRMIREYLNQAPHLSGAELNELRAANMHLLGIGRNLNQIAKRMHSKEGSCDGVTPKYLERLVDYIEQQQCAILNLVRFHDQRYTR